MEISLNELINRQQLRMADLYEQQGQGDSTSPIAANIKQVEDRLDELNGRLERRRIELSQERHCTISDIRRVGVAWVLPHPERNSPKVAPFVRDDEIERIAIEAVIAHERARGWEVTSVEADNRGFDLISRRPHPEDPLTAIEVRFIEVKGRVAVGEVGSYEQRIPHGTTASERLLALCGLQLRRLPGGQVGSGPVDSRMGAARQD